MDHYHALSDKDFIWFPFLFLRPKAHEAIDLRRLVMMIFCFGLYGSLVWPVKQFISGNPTTLNGWSVFSLKCFIFFTLWLGLVTRPLWNQRARRAKPQ